MNKTNITGDYSKLEQVYIQRILDISKEIGFSYVVWQEVFDNGVVVRKIENDERLLVKKVITIIAFLVRQYRL